MQLPLFPAAAMQLMFDLSVRARDVLSFARRCPLCTLLLASVSQRGVTR